MNQRIGKAIIVLLLLMALGYFFWTTTSQQKFYVPPGEHQSVTLFDGSHVDLNADTRLSFKKLDDGTRFANLEGEAFFEVKDGSPFLLESAKGTVEVVGTSFNVYSRADAFEVTCYSGEVKVKVGLEEVILTKERAFKKSGNEGATIYSYVLSPKPVWTSGISLLKLVPLSRVFAEMGRQFNVNIEVKDVQNREYTGRFLHKSLEEALQEVCRQMRLEYEIGAEKVTVFLPR